MGLFQKGRTLLWGKSMLAPLWVTRKEDPHLGVPIFLGQERLPRTQRECGRWSASQQPEERS